MSAVTVRTDVGDLALPAWCGVVTPALEQTGRWEPDDGDALVQALAPGMTVIDVGAHVGYFAILAARAVGPRGRVVAVEPSPENFELLQRNVAASGLDNVETIHGAAWHTTGEVELEICATNSGDHRVGLGDPSRRRVAVPALTLDDVLGDRRTDFVLLDVQGAEREVLEGMRHCLRQWRPRLQAEFWPEGIRSLGGDPEALLERYASLGYEIFRRPYRSPEELVNEAESTPGGFITLHLRPRPTLSICVPTHHGRRPALEQALNSALEQLGDESGDRVEVVVSDNASTDGTDQLMAELTARRPATIVYRRSPSDLGPAANIALAIELARGEYVWLLGSDDQLAPGAIQAVMQLVDEHPGISGLTVNKRNFDPTMTVELDPDPPELLPAEPELLHLYGEAETALTQCGLAHGLISTQVFRRALWIYLADREDLLHRCHRAPHLLMIERMIQEQPRWVWCPQPLVRQRCDPETPARYGYSFYGMQLAILGEIEAIWATLFGRHSAIYASLLDRWCRFVLSPEAIAHHRRNASHTLREDLLMLRFIPLAWRSRYFRRRSLPALLPRRRRLRRSPVAA